MPRKINASIASTELVNSKQVRVRKFVVENSVEERIVELQKRKKHVADEVYNGAGNGDGVGARLNMDDFRLIFQK